MPIISIVRILFLVLIGISTFSKAQASLLKSIDKVIDKSFNIQLEHCDQYPYFGESSHGQQSMNQDFFNSLITLKFFVQENEKKLPSYVKEKYQTLMKILLSDEKKEIKCTSSTKGGYVATSFVNIIYSGRQSGSYKKSYLINFDINIMAGNFPLHITEDEIKRLGKFYSLKEETIIGGTRNPLARRIKNTSSLLFHEMLHWTGSEHFDRAYLDIVYLSQWCLFEHFSIDSLNRKKACDLLLNEALWKPNSKERLQNISKISGFQNFQQLKRLYRQRESSKH